ncbi:MAG: hypothetical protein JXR96_29520, partial [Deltaproteobacteria bacterium]|nr:hypothetical protein [Deltaproteobacteria bacterium]
SKRYGIVTPYTSYLVTEDSPRVATAVPRPPRPMHEPAPPPPSVVRPGWSSVGGAAGPMKAEEKSAYSPPRRRKAKASARMQVFSEQRESVMSAESGAEAVSLADAVKDMKGASGRRDDDDEVSGIRYASGRAFKYRGGTWVDLKYRPGMQLLRIKYLGQAYFALARRSALLKRLFGLGDRVIVVIGTDRAIEVCPDGRDQVPDSELKRYAP